MKNEVLTVILLAVSGVAASDAGAQAAPPQPQRDAPRLELHYDYLHTNGPPGQCDCFNLNGGGGGVVFPLRMQHVALVAGADVAHARGVGTLALDFTLVTAMGGVRYTLRHHESRLQPYAEARAGAAFAGGTLATTNAAGGKLGTAFAGAVGGGVDFRLARGVDVQVIQAEYEPTLFPNGVNGHQNNFQVSAGLVFHLR